MTELHNLATHADFDGCLRALRNGADPNAINENDERKTPLYKVVDHVYAITSPNSREILKQYCLKLLLEYGGDPNVNNIYGVTPLHEASRINDHKCVKILLKNGAHYNARMCNGATPLHWACMWNCRRNVQLLLEAGADPTLTNHHGKTPKDVTESEEIKELIDQYELTPVKLAIESYEY
jgi:ankyrin repeat protein